jgi:hypothetical protein
VGVKCSTDENVKIYLLEFRSEILRVRRNVEELDVDVRMILKWILKYCEPNIFAECMNCCEDYFNTGIKFWDSYHIFCLVDGRQSAS